MCTHTNNLSEMFLFVPLELGKEWFSYGQKHFGLTPESTFLIVLHYIIYAVYTAYN